MLSRFTLSLTPETLTSASTAAPALYRAAALPDLDRRARELITASAEALIDLPASPQAPFHLAVEIDGDDEEPADLAHHFATAATAAERVGDAGALDLLRAAERASRALTEVAA